MGGRHLLLSGIVGSTAYGLAHQDSDIDRLGLFAAPTEELHGLRPPQQSYVTTHPDRTLHEAAKWCRLALAGNPTVMELVWLPEELYEVRTEPGDELIGIRTRFLSARRVRDAYLGYAVQQFRRLEQRGDGPLSAGARTRVAKHARHLKRLCHQGYELYRTGRLTVRLDDPEAFRRFGEQVADDPEAARPLLRRFEEAFDAHPGVLPGEPDERAVEAWLRGVRRRFYGVGVGG
ncbi:nucleotidyltransferase domain-containing protein [Streptomyces sp. NPDC093252]|uniref:nucleotidyltransferase domain-containing protein n=1 Tax=Streptomyces sp. NPDC093252 TaxID=3154980 RepID=UPI00343A7E7C